jgi:TRAP-type C4-dicarboxylate transport system permease small subunit
MKAIIHKISDSIYKAESLLLTVLLLGLVFAGVIQILLRRMTAFAVPDLEITMRWVVVWLTFIGASVATRQNKHVSVDALGRLFTGKAKIILDLLVAFFSFLIVSLLSYYSWLFVMEEKEFGTTVMNNLPAWLIELVFPLGFGLIAFRLLLRMAEDFINLREGEN